MLNSCETKHKKYFAVVTTVLQLRRKWEGLLFSICIDNDEAQWILNMTDATEKVGAWLQNLSDSDFEDFHRAGIKYQELYAYPAYAT